MDPKMLILGEFKLPPAATRKRIGSVHMALPAIRTVGWLLSAAGHLEQIARSVADAKSASLLHLLLKPLMWPRSGTMRQTC